MLLSAFAAWELSDSDENLLQIMDLISASALERKAYSCSIPIELWDQDMADRLGELGYTVTHSGGYENGEVNESGEYVKGNWVPVYDISWADPKPVSEHYSLFKSMEPLWKK